MEIRIGFQLLVSDLLFRQFFVKLRLGGLSIMYKIAVVAIGYNRIPSMERLIDALNKADYGDDQITLYISIDNSGNDEMENCAKKLTWNHGEKIIITHPSRLGLRNHILACGDLLKDYDALVVFEDDIVPASSFYQYAKEAVNFYYEDNNIAGISLYSHLLNEQVDLPFLPSKTKFDAYFLQIAQSWGQVWLKRQWFEFKKWYEKNSGVFQRDPNIPSFVGGWPNTSWLKYHIKYCIDNNKYFVYPYIAFSTCFSDVGVHTRFKESRLQVPLQEGSVHHLKFPKFGDPEAAYYDAFFERKLLAEYLGVPNEELLVDIYGHHTSYGENRYILTTKGLKFKIIKSFALEYRPHELNIIYNNEGDEIFLYDTSLESRKRTNFVSLNNNLKYYLKLYGKSSKIVKILTQNVKQKLFAFLK